MGTIKAVNPTVKWKRLKAALVAAFLYFGRNMNQEKLFIYTMDMKYVRNLHNADDRVQSVSPQIHKSNRPFVGVVVVCNDYQYCIPIDSPKAKHYSMKNDVDFSRIFSGDKLIGVLNFNNMIPVDSTVIKKMNVRINKNDSQENKAYKILCSKELDWIQKNQDAIIKKANKLYNMINSGKANSSLKSRCLDFKKLETVLSKWQSKKNDTQNTEAKKAK